LVMEVYKMASRPHAGLVMILLLAALAVGTGVSIFWGDAEYRKVAPPDPEDGQIEPR